MSIYISLKKILNISNLYLNFFLYSCRSSCGLWMLNFMEYFTGDKLSDTPTQVYIFSYHDIYSMPYHYLKTNTDYYFMLGSYDTF